MKVVILCGGLGTRLREETEFRPKPMVPIGDRPILWHIMKYYAHFGFKEFVLCLGYKGEVIKDYFRNYQWNTSDVTLKLGAKSEICYHSSHPEDDWEVTLLDTGQKTMTGGRVKRALPHVGDEPFFLTYGDGLCNVDIAALLEDHKESGRKVTLTAVKPAGRFGELNLSGDCVTGFQEKPEAGHSFINGGFFVMDPSIGDVIDGDDCILERSPLENMAQSGNLGAFKHEGFWQCMDNYYEQQLLDGMWREGNAPWKVWD